MKKRIGKINTDAKVFSSTDKTAEELLELSMIALLKTVSITAVYPHGLPGSLRLVFQDIG